MEREMGEREGDGEKGKKDVERWKERCREMEREMGEREGNKRKEREM